MFNAREVPAVIEKINLVSGAAALVVVAVLGALLGIAAASA